MYLGPHHFQAQSRYFEDSVRFATSALWFESYGLVGCELNGEALRNGTVSLIHSRGILPDGLPFNMPECDPLPVPRNIAELFPPTRDSVTVLLAIPPRKPDGLNCASPEETPDAAGTRFLAEPQVLRDETTGRDEKPVRLARKNIRLLLDSEVSPDLITLPLARIRRDGSGHFVFDQDFVPPCLDIGASPRLMELLQRLVGILEEKSASLASGQRAGGRNWAEASTRDIASFWMLHAVNSALAPLRHLLFSRRGHPEGLYVELSRLAGALCTFATDSHPRDVPPYHHADLGACFDALDRHIRTHLEIMVPSNCISIPLQLAGDYFYTGEVTDTRCLGPSRWILAIQSPVGEVELISKTPHLVKVCSQQFVPELVRRALPGMALNHLPVPPPAVSVRLEAQYFGIAKAGPCWDHIVQKRKIGVYVPGDLPSPNLELLVVLES
jgi:type VI secretion system protein ImpJ